MADTATKARPVLALRIGDVWYALEPVVQGPGPVKAWKLTKPDGESYCVSRDQWGYACECFGFLRWGERRGECKHIASVRSLGLLGGERG